MKQNWTKADCRRLREGNPGRVRKWIHDYADILYTWICYHYPISVSEAKERTTELFRNVYSRIEEYNPAEMSMYAWLIDRAKQMVPEEKPEAQLPGSEGNQIAWRDLEALAMIGSQELPDSLVEHPVVVQLVQAALTEMDEAKRLILLRRYYRIDPKATIGLDLGFSQEAVGDQLVRARYYFRRCLFDRIYALRPESGFGTDIRINLFEKNLEKIFCSVTPVLKLPEEAIEDLESSLLEQARQIRQQAPAGNGGLSRKVVWISAGVLLTAAMGILVMVLPDGESSLEPVPVPGRQVSENTRQPAEESSAGQMSPEELEACLIRIFNAGTAGDVEMLLEALEEGPFPAQVAAAIYLGRIGDASAIGPLQKAAQQRYSETLEENPFLTAIEQIEQRLRREAAAEEARLTEETEAEAESAEPEMPVEPEVVLPPTEPNLPATEIAPVILPPAEVNEILMEDLTGLELPAEPNVIEEVIWDPNDPEAEWSDEEMEIGEVEYIEEF